MAGVFTYAGVVHALGARELAQRLFSLLCFAATAYVISNLLANLADHPEAVVAIVRWRTAFAMVFYVVLILFVRAQTHAVHSAVCLAFTAAYAVAFIANGLLPLWQFVR